MSALQNLALDLDGRLSVPGDPDWDDVRRAWNLAAEQRPTAVVTAASVRDVQTTVRTAASLGLRVAPQGTGHNATPLDPLVSTILLRTGDLRSVVVDPLARIARVEAGALWQDVTAEAAKHGLMALAGSSGDVGVAGYTLGGGVSWFARSHGFSAQSVAAFDVVTADGRALRADAERNPDLFWALRGGGGGFAVVTAFEIRLYPIREVQAGVLFFPLHRAREVLHAWRLWTLTAPAEITSIGRLLRFPRTRPCRPP